MAENQLTVVVMMIIVVTEISVSVGTVILSILYWHLYHAIEITANQNAGKPLYIRQYSTEPSHRSVQFNVITPNLSIVPCRSLYFLRHGVK